ncbi:hypothetical protein PsorP6_001235 [Peronosclerospora sorghi]|uniref:Uncharacterized protein n=1 Tax=Peronosclerospora sorghi TaxID=230839 RepID=A0ACC0WVU4_9STRA|nr:hypothetical protein PsorP6_001235 [Peronosclerospora sorghi]
MEPPPQPREFSGPPPRSFNRRSQVPNALKAPPVASVIKPQNVPPLPHQPHATQSISSPTARVPIAGATVRNWRPGRGGERHDSPLYGKHRKRPSSSSIDSNISWSGSEIDLMGGTGTVHSEQKQMSRLSWAPSVAARAEALSVEQQNAAPTAASLFVTTAVACERNQKVGSESDVSVQPPKSKRELDDGDETVATQHVRSDLSTLSGTRVASRANSSENVLSNASTPMYDEEKNGPQSCPMTLNNVRQPQFSIDKLRQLRSSELFASKLLPTRTCVNSLLGYVRELQLSEATLRKQLMRTKQHTEEELSHSLLKVSELEKTVQEVEQDRELARQKVQEQEQLIRDLAAKLKQAEEAKSNSGIVRNIDELPPIAEEASQVKEIERTTVKTSATVGNDTSGETTVPPTLLTDQLMQQEKFTIPPVYSNHVEQHQAAQFGLDSPRSPNRPLWDPWASGSATPMKNPPPVFSIGSTGLDPAVSASAHSTLTSTTDVTITKEYELKSVLMSPRKAQSQAENSLNVNSARQMGQKSRIAPAGVQHGFPGQYPAAGFNVVASSSSSFSHEQRSLLSEIPNDPHDVQSDHRGECLIQTVPTLPAVTASPSKREDDVSVCADGKTKGTSGTGRDRGQPEGQSDQSIGETKSGSTSTPTVVLPSSSPTIQTPSPPPPDHNKCVSASHENVSLETLLVDFFTEVDKKRLKMANVYGKRYAGREKWLFAELTKRYGATRVAVLKDRFENMSGEHSGNDKEATNSSSMSSRSNVERQNHPRLPQFFQRHADASNGDRPTGINTSSMPSLTPPQEIPALHSQSRQVTEKTETIPAIAGLSSHSERKQHPEENMPPPSDLPTSSQMPQTTSNNGSTTGTVDNDGPQSASGPPMNHKEKTSDQSGIISSRPQSTMDNSIGLRQRHQPSVYSPKPTSESPVTLEGLIKELYKNHQPDKLKNVSTVAKQYAGKERELVGLLKGKYGALSVRRLEENLDILERAHQARMSCKGARKQRGCVIRMISLAFWLSVLVSFSIGAVFGSFVVLDAWECHFFEEKEHEVAEGCFPLKKELETFTHERVADYVSQSHPESCFCLEWKARERALFATLSAEELINLARMVPFSPESFGSPWIMTVKGHVPAQEFYDSYVKSVVDTSLNFCSFVWSSALELAGFEKGVSKSVSVDTALSNYLDDDITSSHQSQATDIDNQSAADYAGADVSLTEKENIEEDESAAVAPDASEHNPVEEENDALHEEAMTKNSHFSALVEDVISGDRTSEASILSGTEAVEKEQVMEKIMNIPELEEMSFTDEPESIELSTDENPTKGDSVRATVYELESVSGAKDVTSAVTETEGENVAVAIEDVSFNDDDEISNVAFEMDEDIIAENIKTEAESVVEVEMRQEGLDVLYPHPASGGVIIDMPANVSNGAVDENSGQSFSGDKELSAAIDEAESEAASEEVLVSSKVDSIGLSMGGVDEHLFEPAQVEDTTDADVDVTNSEAKMETAVSDVEVDMKDVEKESSSVHFDDNPISVDIDEAAISVNSGEVVSNSEVSRAEPLPEVGSEEKDVIFGKEFLTPFKNKELGYEEAGKDELKVRDASAETDVGSKNESTPNTVVEVVLSGVVDESDLDTERISKQSSVSSDVNAIKALIDEDTAHVLDGVATGVESDSHDDDKLVASTVVEELLSKTRDESENAKESAGGEVVSAEGDFEKVTAGVFSDDNGRLDKAENFFNKDFGLTDETQIEASIDGFSETFTQNHDVTTVEENIEIDKSSISRGFGEAEGQSAGEIDLVSKLDELSDAMNDFGDVVEEVKERVGDAEAPDASNSYVKEEHIAAVEVESSQHDLVAGYENSLEVAVEEAVPGGKVVAAASEEDSSTNVAGGAIDSQDETSLTGGLPGVDDETTHSEQVVNDSSVYSKDSLATINEVLARLVQPFESAKSAAPVVSTDPEPEVEDM